MSRRRRNPFPPFPPTPAGVEQRKWIGDLEFFRPFSAYLLNSLWDSLEEGRVPKDLLPTRESLNVDGGVIDLVAATLAQTRIKGDPFWQSVTPERYASDTIRAIFGQAAVTKRAASAINDTIRALALRARTEIEEAGNTALPASRPLAERYVSAPSAPKPPKPPKPPKVPKAQKPAPSFLPPSRIPDTEAYHSSMSASISEAASAIEQPAPPQDADAPAAAPAYAGKRPPRRRPPSMTAAARRRPVPPPFTGDDLPRIRRLSEATLRAEREYFYSDDDGSLSARGCPMERRLTGFWSYRAGIRPSGYAAPAALLRDYYGDILLLAIPPGNLVQVYVKGAMTEVFASSRTEDAMSIAARYANHWRGVLPDGSISRDAKRSRLTSAILAGYYTDDGVSDITQIAPPIVEVLERDPGARGRKLANPARRGRHTSATMRNRTTR